MKKLILRKARLEDADMYFRWANDPDVRQNALNSREIAWQQHVNWFRNKLTSDSFLLVLESERVPVGQIRFDVRDEAYLLSFSIDKSYRGKGLGRKVITLGIEYMRRQQVLMADKVLAQVKVENEASNKVFESLPFRSLGERNYVGHQIREYELSIR